MPDNIIDMPELREKTHVFQDRAHAGEVLAEMLKDFRQTALSFHKEKPFWLWQLKRLELCVSRCRR
jgi:hypothetical protein